jgi:uncharacterized protein
MPLLINLRHLEAHNVSLQGELSLDELDLESGDEIIQVKGPLEYDLEVQKVENGLLVQGELKLLLQCECVRCLKSFPLQLRMENWARHLPLEGEERVLVVNDCVDLTPYAREDMLLEFPQHPLCNPDCRGLPTSDIGKPKNTSSTGAPSTGSSAWNELNKLKF